MRDRQAQNSCSFPELGRSWGSQASEARIRTFCNSTRIILSLNVIFARQILKCTLHTEKVALKPSPRRRRRQSTEEGESGVPGYGNFSSSAHCLWALNRVEPAPQPVLRILLKRHPSVGWNWSSASMVLKIISPQAVNQTNCLRVEGWFLPVLPLLEHLAFDLVLFF